MYHDRHSLRYVGCAVVICTVVALAACSSTSSAGGASSQSGGASSGAQVPSDPCTLVTTGQMTKVVGVALQVSHQSVTHTCDYSPPGASTNIVAKVTAFGQTADGWSTAKSVAQSSATQAPGSGLQFQPVSEPSADAYFDGDTITAFKDGVQINVWIGQLPGLGVEQLGGSPALLAAETTIAGDALSQIGQLSGSGVDVSNAHTMRAAFSALRLARTARS